METLKLVFDTFGSTVFVPVMLFIIRSCRLAFQEISISVASPAADQTAPKDARRYKYYTANKIASQPDNGKLRARIPIRTRVFSLQHPPHR